MLLVVGCVNEMSNIVQQGADLKQEQIILAQVMKGFRLLKETRRQFGGQAPVSLIKLKFASQMQGGFPGLLPAARTQTFRKLLGNVQQNPVFQADIWNHDLLYPGLSG